MRRLSDRIGRRLREIRPARARPPADRRRTYGLAVVGVAVLSLLALCADRSRLALGFAVAVVLAVLWVAWTAHRPLVTTGLALTWWFITAPTVGLLAVSGSDAAHAMFERSPAILTVGALGVVAGLVAVLSRAPRPALTVVLAWVTNTAAIWAASYLLPGYAWAVGYVTTIAVLAWRAGFRWRRRNRGCPPGVDPGLYELLAAVPGGYVGAVAGPADRAVTVLAAPSGVYAVTPVLRRGTVTATPRSSRLVIDGRPLPRVRTAVRASRLTRTRLRTPVQPVLALLNAGFSDGLARAAPDGATTDLLVIRGDLLAGRLSHGPPVLTGNQIRRLARRIGAAAPRPEEGS